MDSTNNFDDNQTSQNGNFAVSYDDLINKDILELMGEKGMSDEEKTQVYKEMMETIQLRVLKRLNAILSDQEIEKLTEYMDANDKEAFDKYLESKNIDTGKFYAEETLKYKAEMIAMIRQKQEE